MDIEKLLSKNQILLAQKEQNQYKIPFIHAVKRLNLIKDLDEILFEHLKVLWLDEVPFDHIPHQDCCIFLSQTYVGLVLSDPLDFLKRDHFIAYAQSKWQRPIRLYWANLAHILSQKDSSDFLMNLLYKTCHASDLHIHKFLDSVDLKVRVDGKVKHHTALSQKEWEPFHNRLKIMANLDIAEVRRPQSGHTELVIAGHLIDLRISTHPTIHGENMAVRFLDKHKGIKSLNDLGFLDDQIRVLKELMTLSYGLIVLCGPTGSGKTTTLYSLLGEVDTKKCHVATLEDPVEYQLFGICQTEIKYGLLDYKEGIKSLLRQDPDIMLIGEIRDEDTAKMAFRAALTGHLVLTTLHVPHTKAAKTRLMNLGVPEFEIDHYLKAAISQKLVAKKCTSCKGLGCVLCDQTGQKGRALLAELWTPDFFMPMEDHMENLKDMLA
jgi:type II secretory ATPase GspE/PulE/Tfp pilus assembly ATPase PilB-like protein